jgi:hypothetical protein
MTRTDSMVSSGPQTAGAATIGSELHDDRARSRRVARRALLAVPLALAVAIPAPALAQTETTNTTTNATSGYGSKPPVTTTTEPKSGTAPSKEATTPKSAPEPTNTTPATTTPTTTTAPAKTGVSPAAESKLPFTGLDLRWVVGAGLLLLAGGLSLRLTQRRSAGR